MRNVNLYGAVLLTGALALLGTGCNQLKSRDNLNKGVAAYKNAKYSEAVERFQEAVALDDSNPNTRIYLATAYMMQWIPGAVSPENLDFAKKAKDEFGKVLQKDPNQSVALASLASIAFNEADSLAAEEKVAKYDEAASWYSKLIAADAKNRDGYYSLGAIAQKKFYPNLMLARVNMNMKPEDPGPLKDKKVKDELKTKYGMMLDDGIDKLKKALEIDPEYDDAMAYMNLLIRERADLADDKDVYKQQIDEADKWLQKALDTKKIKNERLEKKSAGGVTND
jgi:tetratricopeptide (TPR) repeat protein